MRNFLVALLAAISSIHSHTSLAFAEWQKDIGTLRIGLVTGENIAQNLRYAEPFKLALQDALGIAVELFPAKDFSSLVNAHAEGRVEYAVLSASAYAASHVRCECVEPLAVAKSSDGTLFYKSIIITRKSGPNSVTQLLNKNIIALSQDSMAGYAFPLFELLKSGTDLSQGSTSFEFGTKYNSAAQKFAKGEGDALIGWSSMVGDPDAGFSRGTLKDLAAIKDIALDDFQVIWESSEIPHNVHSIRKNLPGEAKAILRETLQNLEKNDPVAYDSIEPVYSGGFVIARQQSFVPVINFVREPLAGTAK